MINTEEDFNRFLSDNQTGDWIFHVIPEYEGIHPVENPPCILFIRNTLTKKSYYYSFTHTDIVPKMSPRTFVQRLLENLPARKWALDAKSLYQFFPIPDLYDVNLCGFFSRNEILDESDFEPTSNNFLRRRTNIGQINKIIPLLKHKEMFDDMCDSIERMISGFEVNDAYLRFNNITLTTLRDIESNGIFVDSELFKKHFKISPNKHGLVFSQYNVYTSTGRPSNRYNNVNYAALKHEGGSRSCFVSRYGEDGRMVVIDYAAFHPRIICSLTKYPLPIDTDIYEYLAKLYFQKKEVDEIDIKESKLLTFRQLYGGVEDKYSHIRYLANLNTFIYDQWNFFKENNFVFTPLFKRKITGKHIKDPNPSKVFNYILQAVEGEVAITQAQSVMNYLKNKKTKAVLYTYDAILYDFHKGDGIGTLNDIRKIMSLNGTFPMKTYLGRSYDDIQLID